ncbi:unnamed protein product [Colias eurytheme]|nr:unnamed protein product [Colias eurytheme]
MNKSVVVNSAAALWFRIARVFGMAPVSIRSDRDGCRVRACNYSAFYGYVIGVVLNICYIGFAYNVIRYGSFHISERWMWFWAVDFLITLLIIDPVVAGGARLQSVMINDLIQLDKINSQVNSCYADRVIDRKRSTYFIFGLLFMHMLMSIKVLLYDVHFLDTVDFKWFFGIVQFEFFLLLAFKIRLSILNVEIQNSLNIINEELRRLYDMVGNDIEPKSQVFAWSLSRRLRVLCHSYWSTIAIYRRANKANEIKSLIVFLIYAYRLTTGVYLTILRISTYPDKQSKEFALLVWYLVTICVTQLLEMIQFTESYQNIYNEVEKTYITLRRFRHRAKTLGKKVAKLLDVFVDLTLEKAYCTPLGIFTIKSSLVATTIAAMATCLAVVFQFRTVN